MPQSFAVSGKTRLWFAAAALAALAVGSQAAHADYTYKYDITFPQGSPSFEITQWYVLETADSGVIDGFNLGLRLPSTIITSPQGGTVFADFPVPKQATGAVLIGLTHDLPGDAPGQEHVVLGMDTTAASLGAGIAWGTLFRNTLEENIIYDLHNYVNPDQAITQAALEDLDGFLYGDASHGILDNLAQEHSALFDPAAGVFSIQSWSDGTLLGSGVATAVAVPEPTGLAFAGLVGATVLTRRRR